jgi:hypothetical protein
MSLALPQDDWEKNTRGADKKDSEAEKWRTHSPGFRGKGEVIKNNDKWIA